MTDNCTPSMTALLSAAARAAHPIVDAAPHLIDDAVAKALCKTQRPSPLDYQLAQPDTPVLASARLSACVRSAFADAQLCASGLDQYVVLGAGLDTSAHRLPDGGVHTWLLDRPGVLAWRARLLEQAGIPDAGTALPSDLVSHHLIADLTAAGLEITRPAFVAWLGVSMYLDEAVVRRVLADLAELAPGSHLALDHILPPALRDERGAAYASAIAAAAGRADEPWLCTPTPDALSAWLDDAGWDVVQQVDEADATGPHFWPRADSLHPMRLVQLIHAIRR